LVELELDRYVQMSARIPGWTRNAEAEELARISFSLPAECIIVEIGSFFGAGAVLLAGPRRMRGSGKVHCVDPFDGSGDSFSIPHYQRILAAHGGGSLRNHFDKNMKWAGLNEWVEVHQGYASDVAANWMTPVDLLFLDGDQSRSGARAAYDSWSPFLKQGGIIAIHNSNPGPRGVDHDGHLALVTEAIVSPKYDDIRLVQSTTFARKAAP
jgi:predicted O-methyltransferase YrrM